MKLSGLCLAPSHLGRILVPGVPKPPVRSRDFVLNIRCCVQAKAEGADNLEHCGKFRVAIWLTALCKGSRAPVLCREQSGSCPWHARYRPTPRRQARGHRLRAQLPSTPPYPLRFSNVQLHPTVEFLFIAIFFVITTWRKLRSGGLRSLIQSVVYKIRLVSAY